MWTTHPHLKSAPQLTKTNYLRNGKIFFRHRAKNYWITFPRKWRLWEEQKVGPCQTTILLCIRHLQTNRCSGTFGYIVCKLFPSSAIPKFYSWTRRSWHVPCTDAFHVLTRSWSCGRVQGGYKHCKSRRMATQFNTETSYPSSWSNINSFLSNPLGSTTRLMSTWHHYLWSHLQFGVM